MVGMTYWRKGGEEPPRRADEIGGEGVARRFAAELSAGGDRVG